ncbi:MAG: phytanoyl-CoA dioxygenase family protein [Rhizomicrobium sp.]
MSLEVNIDQATPGLSKGEVDYFRKEGFVLPEQGLPSDAVAAMQGIVERVVRDNADWQNLLRMVHVPKRPGLLEGVVGGEDVFRLMFHPVLLSAAESILGPNLIMWGSEMFAKPPGVGKGTPWHQDCYNPVIRSGNGADRATTLMVWIAVDKVDKGNGCLQFIAGSGKNGPLMHQKNPKADALLNFEANPDLLRSQQSRTGDPKPRPIFDSRLLRRAWRRSEHVEPPSRRSHISLYLVGRLLRPQQHGRGFRSRCACAAGQAPDLACDG